MLDKYFNQFSLFGDTAFCSNLLAGTADLSHFPPDIRSMLQLFENPPEITIDPFLTLPQWKDY